MTNTYVIQQQTNDQWESIENGECATLEEAKAGIASLASELGWTGLRVVLDSGPRHNLSGRELTGDDAHEVVFVQGEQRRSLSDWIIIDHRNDKSVDPAVLFADAEWIDRNAADYRADTLTGERSIDDSDIHVYEQHLDGCVAYVARGASVREITLTNEPVGWVELLLDWDTGDSSMEELLASFSLDATSALDEADEAFDGECKVWVGRTFFAGTLGDTREGYYRDPESGGNDPTVFGTFADAQAWVDEKVGSPYFLSHGEASRPSYTICKA